MEEQEKFYLDVLELEPGSRLFYPLAEIYVRQGRLQEAQEVLRNGLKQHPGHFEARLLLASACHQLGDAQASQDMVREIFSGLEIHPFFWETLSRGYEDSGREAMALALGIISAESAGNRVSLADILQRGLKNFLNSGKGGEVPQGRPESEKAGETENEQSYPETAREESKNITEEQEEMPVAGSDGSFEDIRDEDAEEVEDLDFEEPARTRSMADLLYRQGEYEQSLRIYRYLWESEMPGGQRRELEEIIAEVKKQLEPPTGEEDASKEAAEGSLPSGDISQDEDLKEMQEDIPEKGEEESVVDTLSLLADRLEQRAEQ